MAINDQAEDWDLIENPINDVYKNLMKVLCTHSDHFYFVTRKELKYDKETLAQFIPFVMEMYKTKEWAGTKTKGPAATVYLIEACNETYELLIQYANSLFDWMAPRLPEDLTFIKNNYVWFSSTTHEGYAGFSIRSKYYKKIMLEIEGLKLKQNL